MFSIIQLTTKQICLVNIIKEDIKMENKLFMRADEVAKELGVSQAYAYKLIKQLNEELKAKGYLVISGRLNREYFAEKVYKKHVEKEE